MIRKSALTLLATAILLSACQTDDRGSGSTVGTLGNPATDSLGGMSHSSDQDSLTLTTVFFRGLDNRISPMIEDADKVSATKAEQRAYAAPVGQQVTWNDPSNGTAGTITPTRDGYAANGSYCREFQETITVSTHHQQAYGKACQQADGSWSIVQ